MTAMFTRSMISKKLSSIFPYQLTLKALNSMENPPPKPVHPLARTYTEIYDTKSNNTKIRPKGKFFYCNECKAWQGHEITCSQVTIESIATLLTHSRDAEQHARNRAAKWLDDANRLAGRVAIFRHENNKLRKANEKLRKENAELRDHLVQLGRAAMERIDLNTN
jgi:hypothetical protein